jgi:hypothetical protein
MPWTIAQNLLCFRIDADFQESLSLAFLICPAHSAHRIFRDKRTTPGPTYFGVRHAAATERRIDVQCVGLNSIRNTTVIGVEQIVGDDLIIVVGSVSKGAVAVAVAWGSDSGRAGLQFVVNDASDSSSGEGLRCLRQCCRANPQ